MASQLNITRKVPADFAMFDTRWWLQIVESDEFMHIAREREAVR